MARGRKAKDVGAVVASLSTTKKIEFFIQMFGWSEQQILQSIGHENPTIIEDDHIRNMFGGEDCEFDPNALRKMIALIRVSKSKYSQGKTEQIIIDDIVGKGEVVCFDDIEADPVRRVTSGLRQIDELYGYSSDYDAWGMPRGQVGLMAGSPGVGKTRLMTSICGHMTHPENQDGFSALYFQNEFALSQFKQLNKNTIVPESRFLCGDLVHMQDQVDFLKSQDEVPDLVVIDSVQMLAEAKSKSGIERCIAFYKQVAMELDIHVCFIGQLNKAGEVAGSRSVEHLVDQVFTVRHMFLPGQFGVNVTKNRWGESGISARFEHTPEGVICVSEGRKNEGESAEIQFDNDFAM
ncbi:hypothetical protein CMI47_04115 [Candidatus Pacearchaeota archaeon]|jgi:predicted ATP-dependent serine protease|nr:hypothetical protein [Candidatus Pacearchaeota archaeon]|tara:strand:- start:888 stop:1937 length:1050 start_codon:yes stop_codon:yes gene_type:complete